METADENLDDCYTERTEILMSKRRQLTPFAVILKALNSLTDDEKTTLRDVLRPEPTPRKKVGKRTRQVVTVSVMCGTCGYPADHSNHDLAYSSAHPFQSFAAVPHAKRQSPRKSAQQPSVASSAIETGTVTAVGASGD